MSWGAHKDFSLWISHTNGTHEGHATPDVCENEKNFYGRNNI